MSKQPEALRLAEILPQFGGATVYQAAAELRRLHALNGELLSMLKESVKPLHLYRAYGWTDRLRVIDRVEALISKAEANV